MNKQANTRYVRSRRFIEMPNQSEQSMFMLLFSNERCPLSASRPNKQKATIILKLVMYRALCKASSGRWLWPNESASGGWREVGPPCQKRLALGSWQRGRSPISTTGLHHYGATFEQGHGVTTHMAARSSTDASFATDIQSWVGGSIHWCRRTPPEQTSSLVTSAYGGHQLSMGGIRTRHAVPMPVPSPMLIDAGGMNIAFSSLHNYHGSSAIKTHSVPTSKSNAGTVAGTQAVNGQFWATRPQEAPRSDPAV